MKKGSKMKPESLEKKRLAALGNKSALGNKWNQTEDSKKAIGDSHRNKSHTEEHNQKISEALEGHIVPKETREKISASLTGVSLSEEHKQHIAAGHEGISHTEAHNKNISKGVLEALDEKRKQDESGKCRKDETKETGK